MKIVQKKICLLGDFSVGKTSLIRRFVEERFDEKYLSTIGVHMSRKRLERNNHFLDLFIWDLAGGEDFDVIGPNYLRGAAGAIIVCDLTRLETLPALSLYARRLRATNPKAALVFVGNKVDLVNDRLLTDEMLQNEIAPLADRFFLTSAKTGEYVDETFGFLADQIEG